MAQEKSGGQQTHKVEQKHALRFRLITSGRWLVATVRTEHSHLIDLLNEDREIVVSEQVKLQGDIYAYKGLNATSVRIWPGRAVLVVPLDGEEGEGEENVEAEPAGNGHERRLGQPVRLGVGTFEVVGQIMLPEGASLEDCLTGKCPRFVAVNRAVVRRTDGVGPMYQQATVLVNRDFLEYAMPAPGLPLFDHDLGHGMLD